MDYKIKEIVTKDNIKRDIRNQSVPILLRYFPLIPTSIGGSVFLWHQCNLHEASMWDNHFIATLIIVYIFISLCVVVFWVFLIIRYFQSLKTYSIMIDKFTGIYAKSFWLRTDREPCCHFHFAANGNFNVYFNKIYYPWADYYKMYGTGVMQCSIPDEEFYVVVSNKKIVSIYRKKCLNWNRS